MIQRTATTVTLLAALMLGFGTSSVQAEGKAPTACEKKADKKKITDPKKRENYIKKCEKKQKKSQ